MQRRPNILWLNTDHNLFANHYDYQPEFSGRLATYEMLRRQGREYTQAYCVCPLCTPARASMLTGVYPHRHGMVLNPDVEDPSLRKTFDRPEEMIAHGLTAAGYRAVQLGKWHVGEKLSQEMGFEGWTLPGYGRPYQSAIYKEYLERNNLPAPVVRCLWDAHAPERAGGEYPLDRDPIPFSATRQLLTPRETHEAFFVADAARQWLRNYRQDGDDRPFLLKADVWGPHHPYDTVAPYSGRIDPTKLKELPSFAEQYLNKPSNYSYTKEYWKSIAYMDWEQMSRVLAVAYEHAILVDDALGTILTELDQLGLSQSTMVILTADHGDILAAHGGLFNKETLLVEEIMRIPMVVRWPGAIAPGETWDNLVTNMDVPATVLAAAGATADYSLDGRDLLSPDPREHLMCQTFGCRQREFVQRLLRWKQYKYIAHHDDMDELYNLAEDPFELTNHIDQPEYAAVLREMRSRLKQEMLAYGDTQREAAEIIKALVP